MVTISGLISRNAAAAISGFCMAGMIIVTESWLNARCTRYTRGKVMAFYMITNYFAAGCGQFLIHLRHGQFDTLAGDKLPAKYRHKLMNYRHGPGVFKIDWALDGPIPWSAEQCRHEYQMPRARNRQELDDALHNRKHDDMNEVHRVSLAA